MVMFWCTIGLSSWLSLWSSSSHVHGLVKYLVKLLFILLQTLSLIVVIMVVLLVFITLLCYMQLEGCYYCMFMVSSSPCSWYSKILKRCHTHPHDMVLFWCTINFSSQSCSWSLSWYGYDHGDGLIYYVVACFIQVLLLCHGHYEP